MPRAKNIKDVLSIKKSQVLNPNETRGLSDEDDPEIETTCPICGLDKTQWKAHNGAGYELSGEIFCCQECARGGDCICVS